MNLLQQLMRFKLLKMVMLHLCYISESILTSPLSTSRSKSAIPLGAETLISDMMPQEQHLLDCIWYHQQGISVALNCQRALGPCLKLKNTSIFFFFIIQFALFSSDSVSLISNSMRIVERVFWFPKNLSLGLLKSFGSNNFCM